MVGGSRVAVGCPACPGSRWWWRAGCSQGSAGTGPCARGVHGRPGHGVGRGALSVAGGRSDSCGSDRSVPDADGSTNVGGSGTGARHWAVCGAAFGGARQAGRGSWPSPTDMVIQRRGARCVRNAWGRRRRSVGRGGGRMPAEVCGWGNGLWVAEAPGGVGLRFNRRTKQAAGGAEGPGQR